MELKNEENIPEDKAYINITINEMSCHSLVGKVGFIQPLEIGGCSGWWMILHEFVHALGIFFFTSQYMYYYSNDAYRASKSNFLFYVNSANFSSKSEVVLIYLNHILVFFRFDT